MLKKSTQFFIALTAIFVAMIVTIPCFAADTTFVGKFSNGNLTIELTGTSDAYTGGITFNNQKYPATAQGLAQGIDGTFVVDTNSLPFSATLIGDTLTLTSQGATYTLNRVSPPTNSAPNPLANLPATPQPMNPVAQPPPENPVAQVAPNSQPVNPVAQAADNPQSANPPANPPNDSQTSGQFPDPQSNNPVAIAAGNPQPANLVAQAQNPAANSNPLAAYTVEVSTDCGQSLLVQKTNVTSVEAALEATVPDLATFFGAMPTFGNAFQPNKDPSFGGVTFSATHNGQPVEGLISCKLHDNATATIAITYAVKDAPKAEWEYLLKPSAQSEGGPNSAAPQTANIHFTEYDFPDGTGKIGIPDGWTMNHGDSELHPCAITGPAGQQILLHSGVTVQTPDSPQVQNRQRLEAQRQYIGGQPLPMIFVAPFTDPINALPILIPQFSQKSQMNNGPAITLDRIISAQNAPTRMQGIQRAIITYAFTRTLNGQSDAYRTQIDASMSLLSGGGGAAWMWWVRYSAQAPDATFDQDLPIMLAIIQSDVPNGQRAMEVGRDENNNLWQAGQNYFSNQRKQELAQYQQFQQKQDQQFAMHEDQIQEMDAERDAHNADFEEHERQRAINSADFEQTALGFEEYYNTATNQSSIANLDEVDGIVNGLNGETNDPGVWKKYPLREQLVPDAPPGGP